MPCCTHGSCCAHQCSCGPRHISQATHIRMGQVCPASLIGEFATGCARGAIDCQYDESTEFAILRRADAFPSDQLYLLLCLPYCGADLEAFKLSTWSEAAAILWQVACSLSFAERACDFEVSHLAPFTRETALLVDLLPRTASRSTLGKYTRPTNGDVFR